MRALHLGVVFDGPADLPAMRFWVWDGDTAVSSVNKTRMVIAEEDSFLQWGETMDNTAHIVVQIPDATHPDYRSPLDFVPRLCAAVAPAVRAVTPPTARMSDFAAITDWDDWSQNSSGHCTIAIPVE